MAYASVIGLEIHIELKTHSKMFCGCLNNPDEKAPNRNICPVCSGHPGTLPVANEEAIRKTIKTGLALNCQIQETSKFDRKNYFYPDLPKGYQISQYDAPFCRNGYLEIQVYDEKKNLSNSQFPISNDQKKYKKVRIRRVHLEEDTGRLQHPDKADYSLVDFNRAGVPLMELVTEPDIQSGKEARKFSQELQLILRYLGVSSADMEKGQMRVEVNISLGRNLEMGTKVEIKNLNSFRVVEKAIDYEIERQAEILEKGGKIIQETRGWNDAKGITVSQREKEEAHDYRYFPEPDLPTFRFGKDFISEIKSEIPELPSQKRERFLKEYGLDEKTIEIFVSFKDLSEYFEKVSSELQNWLNSLSSKISDEERNRLLKLTSNYIISDLMGLSKGAEFSEEKCRISPENFAEFIVLIYEGRISSKIAKQVLEEMFDSGKDPSLIIEEKGLSQISDDSEIEKIINEIILKNQKAVQDYKKGKEASFQFLVGQIMAATRGRAKPEIIRQKLKEILENT